MAGYPKKEINEGNQKQADGHDTIYNPPYQHNRSPPYILFPLSLENGLRKPPQSIPRPGRACVRLYYASKHRLPSCIHVCGGRMCKMGFEGKKGEGRIRRAKERSVDRSCRSVAGQGLGRSVFVIELETHSHLYSTTQTDKQTNTKISQSSVKRVAPKRTRGQDWAREVVNASLLDDSLECHPT